MVVTSIELTDFQRLDGVVRRYSKAFKDCGNALAEIKSRDLWREKYSSWEDYCKDAIGWTGRRSNQIISAASATETIESGTTVPAPVNESQVRSIAGKSADHIIKTWVTAVTLYGDTPTAEQVKQTSERIDEDSPTPPEPPDPDETTRRMVERAGHQVVIQRMKDGTYTPKKALELSDEFDKIDDKVRDDVLRIGVEDVKVIRQLDQMYSKRLDSYDEVIRSQCLQFMDAAPISIHDAKVKDIRKWLNEKSQEHRRNAFGDKLVRDQQPVTVVAIEDGRVTLKIAGIQHDLVPGEEVIVTIVRTKREAQ